MPLPRTLRRDPEVHGELAPARSPAACGDDQARLERLQCSSSGDDLAKRSPVSR